MSDHEEDFVELKDVTAFVDRKTGKIFLKNSEPEKPVVKKVEPLPLESTPAKPIIQPKTMSVAIANELLDKNIDVVQEKLLKKFIRGQDILWTFSAFSWVLIILGVGFYLNNLWTAIPEGSSRQQAMPGFSLYISNVCFAFSYLVTFITLAFGIAREIYSSRAAKLFSMLHSAHPLTIISGAIFILWSIGIANFAVNLSS